ncbi:Transforming growth factor-beta-induced protein [Balamuthia mandrillaris]
MRRCFFLALLLLCVSVMPLVFCVEAPATERPTTPLPADSKVEPVCRCSQCGNDGETIMKIKEAASNAECQGAAEANNCKRCLWIQRTAPWTVHAEEQVERGQVWLDEEEEGEHAAGERLFATLLGAVALIVSLEAGIGVKQRKRGENTKKEMGKSIVVLMLFAAFLAVPSFASAESTTINFNFKGLIPGGSCEPEPCVGCQQCEQCGQCPQRPTEDLVALATRLGLSTFLAGAEACGLIELFTNPNSSYTLFAPSNEAFGHLPDGYLDFLLGEPEIFSPLLLGHVVRAVLPTISLVNGMTIPPAAGLRYLSIDLSGGIISVWGGFSVAAVVSADDIATNGVIHVIDTLLYF